MIANAKHKLAQLENTAYIEQQDRSEIDQFDLFTSQECHPALVLLAELDPDQLSPRQALDYLYRLAGLMKNYGN